MRLAIISDIHEDYPSLQKVIKKAERKGYDQLICLGDISGFSKEHYMYMKERNAHACLELVREKCEIIVPGNHDFHAARRIPLHSDTFNFPDNWYDLSPEDKKLISDDTLWLHEMDELPSNYLPDDMEFLRALPEFKVLKTEECNILFSHYVYPNLSGFKKGFYTWVKEFQSHFEFMEAQACSIGITGHGHVRGLYIVNRTSFNHYAYRKVPLKEEIQCLGLPPVTRQKSRRGFCIFDSNDLWIKGIRVI